MRRGLGAQPSCELCCVREAAQLMYLEVPWQGFRR